MRKCLLACVVLFSMAVLVSASQEQSQGQKPGKVQVGEALSIDAAKGLIVIKSEAGAEVNVLVTPATKITREGKKATLADIKAGDKVTTECEESAEGCKAKSVEATGAKPSQ